MSMERPILFSPPMVRALLAGNKTQTRRIAKFVPLEGGNLEASSLKAGHYFTGKPKCGFVLRSMGGPCWNDRTMPLHSPYGLKGARLWVRVGWRPEMASSGDTVKVTYLADGNLCPYLTQDIPSDWKIPKAAAKGAVTSLFMPRWASRITLEITDIRVERLRDISEEDALAEGVEPWGMTEAELANLLVSDESPETKAFWKAMGPGQMSAKACFQMLWDTINGKTHPWESNPWVWVVAFKRVAQERKAA